MTRTGRAWYLELPLRMRGVVERLVAERRRVLTKNTVARSDATVANETGDAVSPARRLAAPVVAGVNGLLPGTAAPPEL